MGKSFGGLTTHFLVDELNPTGWPQVLEIQIWAPANPLFTTPAVTRVFSYGRTPLSQDQLVENTWTATHFCHDAHGNVLYLSDLNGQVSDTFDYDAFGSLIAHSGTTPVAHLFTGEEFDADLGLYNLRARYHNPATGRFWTRDSFEGYLSSPASRHGYAYAQNNPVNFLDLSGHESMNELLAVSAIAVDAGRVMASLWNGINHYSYGSAGGGQAGPNGKALLAKNGTEGLFIQGLSQHAGINLGLGNFFAAARGAPFLLAQNPFVFALENKCFQYLVLGFDADAPVEGCPNRNPVFTFDYSNNALFKFAEGLVGPKGAARGVARGARDLVTGAYDLAENVVGAAAYNQMSMFAPELAQTLFGPQAVAFDGTVAGAGQLGWDLANGAAYNLIAPFDAAYAQESYGDNLNRLHQTIDAATGGAGAGFAERFSYTATQILLPGQATKAAEVGLARFGRSGAAADAATAARSGAVAAVEANAELRAALEGRAAAARAEALAKEEVLNYTPEALEKRNPCLETAENEAHNAAAYASYKNEPRQAEIRPQIPFGKGITAQGQAFEDFLDTQMPGTRLPPRYKTIDFFDPETGLATSAKTLDTTTPAKVAKPNQIFNTLKGYVDKVEDVTTAEVDGVEYGVNGRDLQLAVPANTTPAQWVQIERAIDYARRSGVNLKVIIAK